MPIALVAGLAGGQGATETALPPAMAAGFAAAGLPDPTRPPAALLEAPAAGAGSAAVAPPAPGGLQSTIRRQGAKPGAVIDGVYVELGGKVGEARLARVGEDSVELRSAAGKETLRLTPKAEKQPAADEGWKKNEAKP